MQEVYFIEDPTNPDTWRGSLRVGDLWSATRAPYQGEELDPEDPGDVRLRHAVATDQPPYYPLVKDVEPVARYSIVNEWDGVNLRVLQHYPLDPVGIEEAAALKYAEIDERWNKAMNDGAPVTISTGNGPISALVRYEEKDRNRYAAVHDPAAVPADGLLAISLTEVNGKTRFTLKGTPKITELLDQTLAHRNAGDIAWDQGYEDIEGFVAAGNVEAIQAYNVEALPWPSNALP